MSHHKTLNGLWTQVVIELRVFVVIFGFKGHDESKTERAVVKAYLRKSSYCSPKSLKSFSRQNPKRTWQPLNLYLNLLVSLELSAELLCAI